MFGGLLEYASLIVGYRSLLVVVALLYGLAFLTGRKELAAPSGDEATAADPSATAGSSEAGATVPAEATPAGT